MAHLLTLTNFYLKYWLKEAKLLLGILQVHVIILVFNLAYPSLSFLIAPFILTFVIQIFYSDWESRQVFYSVVNIRLIDRHYVKIVLLNIVIFSFLIHLQLKSGTAFSYTKTLLVLVYLTLLFSFFHFVSSKFISILIFIFLSLISIFLTWYLKNFWIHSVLIISLVITNGGVYYSQLKKLK